MCNGQTHQTLNTLTLIALGVIATKILSPSAASVAPILATPQHSDRYDMVLRERLAAVALPPPVPELTTQDFMPQKRERPDPRSGGLGRHALPSVGLAYSRANLGGSLQVSHLMPYRAEVWHTVASCATRAR
jgi:hypothetical protein